MKLLSQQMQQSADGQAISLVWFSEGQGADHGVFDNLGRLSLEVISVQLGWLAEDRHSNHVLGGEQLVYRDIWRHEASLGQLQSAITVFCGSCDSYGWQYTEPHTVSPRPAENQGLKVLLTSDYQLDPNSAQTIEYVGKVVGQDLGAIFFAGDFVNSPDRASEWFDTYCGNGFFDTFQGQGKYRDKNDRLWRGARLLQQGPIYPCIGNHEVNGRLVGTDLSRRFHGAIPKSVAAQHCPPDRQMSDWLNRNSFTTRTYSSLFTLPAGPQNSNYYSVSVGNIFLISLFVTRPWRPERADPDPCQRTMEVAGRYQEPKYVLSDPLSQGWGSFAFESIAADSEQIAWLKTQLTSKERMVAKYTIVMMHEGPHSIGKNCDPTFCVPERIEEFNDQGELIGIRYEYTAPDDRLIVLAPILEEAKVNLVFSGHSHLWSRFISPCGTHYLESSNVGNSHGVYHASSKQTRTIPPFPWKSGNGTLQGDPGGLEPQYPTELTLRGSDGSDHPYLSSKRRSAFSVLDSDTGQVTSWLVDFRDTDTQVRVFDKFSIDNK